MKKAIIIGISTIFILAVIFFVALDFVGDLIFDSLISNEFNELNNILDASISDETELDLQNNNINIHVLNNNNDVSNSTTNPISSNENNDNNMGNTDNKNKVTSNDSKQTTNTNLINESSNTNINNNINNTTTNIDDENNVNNENPSNDFNDYTDNLNIDSNNYEVLEDYLDEETKETIKNNSDNSSSKEPKEQVYDSDTIKNVRDSVTTSDKLFVATKVLTKLNSSQLNELVSMLSSGVSLDEKIRAIEIVKESFNNEEIENIRKVYRKYMDDF